MRAWPHADTFGKQRPGRPRDSQTCRGRGDERDRSDVSVAHVRAAEASSPGGEGPALYSRHKALFCSRFFSLLGKAPALTRCTFK